MRELLIRYLLGELDADERREVQSRLQSSPQLRTELSQLRSCLAANQDDDLFAPEPPSGLAARTTGRVTGCDDANASLTVGRNGGLAHGGDPPAGILGWSLADLTVAGGVMLAVSMLIFPALRNSRDGTRLTVCKDHQRQIYVYIANYAQIHHGFFPEVGSDDNAGVFTARLIGNGHVQPEDLAILLVCPGAPLADKIRSGEFTIRLPNAEEIRAMTPVQLAHVTSTSSPFYNYRLPYRVGGHYCNIRDEHRNLSPVLSDASGGEPGDLTSPNHGGKVVQLLCADGSSKSLRSFALPGIDEDMLRNDLGEVAAGLTPLDTVLGPSNATPGGDGSAQGK